MYDFLKRIMDVIGGIAGIIVFAPLMFVTAIMIKLVSPDGPVLADIKNRSGKDGKEFRMYKFRSMVPNAQQVLEKDPELYAKYQANGYKLDPDPRIIKGGNFIRRTSIDELPQFFNVLFGDMSLVGPRAYFPFEIKEQRERYPQSADSIDYALSVKPGITGVWQISGRSQIGFVERIKMDADYAKRKSIVYDLLIVLKTPLVVLTKKGAV